MDSLQLHELVDIAPFQTEVPLKVEDVADKTKKLILIQAPANFDMDGLKGQKFILDGCQDIPADDKNGKDRRYEIKSKMNCRKHFKTFSVILPSEKDSKLQVAKPIKGSINIVQTIRVPPVSLPEKEELVLPEIPQNRKHRWTPYGCDSPLKLKKEDPATPIRKTKSKKKAKNSNPPESSFEVVSRRIVDQKPTKVSRKRQAPKETNESLDNSIIVSPKKIKKERTDDSGKLLVKNESSSPKKKSKHKKRS